MVGLSYGEKIITILLFHEPLDPGALVAFLKLEDPKNQRKNVQNEEAVAVKGNRSCYSGRVVFLFI